MQDNAPPPPQKRSFVRRVLRSLFSRRTGIALIWILSLIALCYAVIDWRDHRAWNDYRQNYEAHVASLDLTTYIPKPIPDDQNFAATPFVQSWFNITNENFLYNQDAYTKADKIIDSRSTRHEWHFLDLVAWEKAMAWNRTHKKEPNDSFRTDDLDLASRAQAAPAVLEELKDDQAAFDELRTASARPYARYGIRYNLDDPWAILLPHLARAKGTCQRLRLKACAELAAGQPAAALDDINLALYLADTFKAERFLISYLVRVVCVEEMCQPVWEGLAEHRWTDAQLQQLEDRFTAYNFVADMEPPMQSERAATVYTIGLFRDKGMGLLVELSNVGGASVRFEDWQAPLLFGVGWLAPSGWYDREKLNLCQLSEDEFRGAMDPTAPAVFPSQLRANVAPIGSVTANAEWFNGSIPAHGVLYDLVHHRYMAEMFLPSLSRIPISAARGQTVANEAALACALERYRLAKGEFPADLQALTPQFIAHVPNDVIGGQPFHYRRTDDKRFILYSVGWNEKDDDGMPGKTQFDETEGDWVWNYPATNSLTAVTP